MPHKCTKCDKIFEDGSKEILSGCPECGWNKFLYVSDKEDAGSIDTDEVMESPLVKTKIREIDELLSVKPLKDFTPSERDRIESVRILGPGSYELNMKTLLEQKEIVMALKEDGNYVIHLPSAFARKDGK